MDQQELLAQILRRTDQSGALQDANAQANSLAPLAAISQLMNNPGAARAAQSANINQQARFKPVQMGTQGFMLPQSGQFAESPMYVDEKNAARETRVNALADTLAMREKIAADAIAQKREHDATRSADQQRHDRNMSVLRTTIAGMSVDPRIAAGEKADAAKEKAHNANVTKFSTLLDKEGVPEFEQALGMVEGTLNKYPSGKLPGAGRAESFLPSVLADTETQMVRTDMQRAANILLAARSGKAVTDSEQRRFLVEVGQGKGMAEDTLRKGWKNVRDGFESKKDNLLAGVGDDVLSTYNERSPITLARRPKQEGTPAADEAPRGGVDALTWKHMTPKERALFK